MFAFKARRKIYIMRKLTKISALVLAMLMLVSSFCACSQKDEEDNGPYVYAYITSESPVNLDPGLAQYNSDMVKYLGLLYEGLFKMDASGKVKKALCDDYYVKEVDGENRLYIELKDTKWSDGVSVTASNIVYAWKRLLEPGYEGPGASMLMCIKNAVAVKEGVQKMMTVDDLGLVELNEKLLEIRFEDPDYDIDLFIQTLASPYLVPVREELVNSNPTGWATVNVEDPTTIATNGPFCIRAWTTKSMTLGRNSYYYLEGIADEDKQKYVNVDKIYVSFGTAAKAAENFNATANGTAEDNFLFYMGEFDDVSAYKTKSKDMLSTVTVLINTGTKALAKSSARRALSALIDRNALAASVNGRAAEGLVPFGVIETAGSTKQFRKAGGNVLSKYFSDTSEASSLKGKTITVTAIKDDPVHEVILKRLQEDWGKSGVSVKTRRMEYDKYVAALEAGNYEAIIFDLHAYTADAFSVLSQFTVKYNGRALSQNENYEYGFMPGSTGLNNENFNTYMDNAFAETNLKTRAKLLHDAEYILLDAMVAIPLYHNVDYYTTTQMSGADTSWFGFRDFNDVTVKNYKFYIEFEDAKLDAQLGKTGK